MDDCDTADWTESTDATADALGSRISFGDSSIKLGKSGTASNGVNYTKTKSSTVDGTGRRLKISLFIENLDILAVDKGIILRIGNSDSAYYEINLDKKKLQMGVNSIDLIISDMGTTGSPDITTLDYIYIGVTSFASATTITSGDISMDYWRLEDINSLDSEDVKVYYATLDTQGGIVFGSPQTVSAVLAEEGRITMSTAPTSTTAKAGVFCDYSYVSNIMDWNLINTASCYMAAHLSSLKIAGDAPNFDSIADVFARRDIAGVPDEWLRLSYSVLINAVGENETGVGFRRVETHDLTGV